jgi:hypothetical protein
MKLLMGNKSRVLQCSEIGPDGAAASGWASLDARKVRTGTAVFPLVQAIGLLF